MAEWMSLWRRQTPRGRAGLVLGLVFIVALATAAAIGATGREWRPLFTDLAEQDAATLVAELDRMKLPYRLDAGGTRILVPEEVVHKTRLHLVGRNLPLNGAVGFEIFNHTDFGMTEFNQRVNYQRALQGELTRTIASLDEVRSARVHLVLPESTLFKREQSKPKASVALSLNPGRSLHPDQVLGIQRLVSAAVPGIEAADVTVLDQSGTTLSRPVQAQGESAAWQLQARHEVEQHLARKAAAVLDRAYGAGQGLVSVDVALNFDQIKRTTEEVLGTHPVQDAPPSGVMVRERQTVRDTPSTTPEDGPGRTARAEVTQSDIEYQAGRRIEQIVAAPGSVRRLSVAVVLPHAVGAERTERVRQLVSAAVGLDLQRGDSIAVHSLDQVSERAPTLVPASDASDRTAPSIEGATAAGGQPSAARPAPPPVQGVLGQPIPALTWLLASALALAVTGMLLFSVWRRRRQRRLPTTSPPELPQEDREVLLRHMRQWLLPPDGTPQERPVP